MNTETQPPRLIDANALIAKLEENQENYEQYREIVKGLQKAIDAIHSAPTVETTDEVLARVCENPFISNVRIQSIVTDSLPSFTIGFYVSAFDTAMNEF